MTKPVIDMRSRPSFLHPFFGAAPGTPDFEVVRWLNRRVGGKDIEHFTRTPDAASFVAEMDRAGISVAVMVARSVPGVRVENAALAEVAATAPRRLVGIASVDPIELGKDRALSEARKAITELGLAGLNLDAGFYADAMTADDARLTPFYELCLELGVPAFVMSGPDDAGPAGSTTRSPSTASPNASRSCRSSAATASTRTSARWSPWLFATRTSSSHPICTRSRRAPRSMSRRRRASCATSSCSAARSHFGRCSRASTIFPGLASTLKPLRGSDLQDRGAASEARSGQRSA